MKKHLTTYVTAILASCLLLTSVVEAQSDTIGKICPSNFHELPLFPEARLCQMFDDSFPATLTYHADIDMDGAAAFYLKELGNSSKDVRVKGRRVLHFGNNSPIVIISPDGQGSQVDVLMKRAL